MQSPQVQTTERLDLEPMDPSITSIQPGGGICMRLELLWGHGRRWYLKRFRRNYVAKMLELRQADPQGCPHEVLDQRDMKFYCNQGPPCWATEDDPFAWRDRLGLVRAGLAEVVVLGGSLLVVTFVLAWCCWPLSLVSALLAFGVLWFFRDPRRAVPVGTGVVVAPADGRVVSVDQIEDDPFVGSPAIKIGIFLSIFNVHINRSPMASRVIGLTYRKGKFLNALLPASARENEQLAIRLESTTPPYRRMVVRQIAGAIARRIVCWVRPGDLLREGAQFGMIKLGSRTELILPQETTLEVLVNPGQKVKAGVTILARYNAPEATADRSSS